MEKEITVQELIDQLNKIKNKNIPVDIVVLDEGVVEIKPIPSGKTVSISLGTNGYWKAFNKAFDELVSVKDSNDQFDKHMLEKTTKAMSGNEELATRVLDHQKRVALALKYGTTL